MAASSDHFTGTNGERMWFSRRQIAPEMTRRLLGLINERGARFNPQAFVFATRNGTGLQRKVARAALDRAVKAANLAAPKPTLHDLRHTHASMLIALDCNLIDVQRRLGHRKPDTTLRVYAHEWKYREAQRSQVGASARAALRRRRSHGSGTVAAATATGAPGRSISAPAASKAAVLAALCATPYSTGGSRA